MALTTIASLSVSPIGGVSGLTMLPMTESATDTMDSSRSISSVDKRVISTFKRKREESERSLIELGHEFHAAIETGDETTVQTFIDLGIDLDEPGREGLTALQIAVKEGHLNLVQLLLDEGADESIKTREKETLFHLALRGAKASSSSEELLQIMQILFEAGIDLDERDCSGVTALHIAAGKGLTEVVDFILGHWTIKDPQDKSRSTPLHLAAEAGHEAIVKKLLDTGSDPSIRNYLKMTPLHCAVEEGHVNVVRLLARPEIINAQDNCNRSPFMLAVIKKSTEMAEALINLGADFNLEDDAGRSPLHAAVIFGHESMARLLLSVGANLDFVDEEGDTPLHHAVKGKSLNLMSLLLENGCDQNAANNERQTPLHVAATIGEPELSRLLITWNADLKSQDQDGTTPLMAAAKEGRKSTVEMLMNDFKDKIAFDQTDASGFTAYTIAAAYGFPDIAEIIGSDPYSETFLACKALAQMTGIEEKVTISGQEINLMGFIAGYFCADAYHFDMPDDVKEAFAIAANPRKNHEIVERVKSNKITIISTGTIQHSIFIVIHGTRMIICNRGYGGEEEPAISTYKIDPSKFNLDIIEEMRLVETEDDEEINYYFYRDLPTVLTGEALTKAELEENNLIESISPKAQKYSNCTAASFKTAMRAALALKALEEKGTLTRSDVLAVKAKSKEISTQIRKFYEKKYSDILAKHLNIPLEDLFALLLQSVLKRIKRYDEVNVIEIPIAVLCTPKISQTIKDHGKGLHAVISVVCSKESEILYPLREHENIQFFIQYIKDRDGKEENFISLEILKEAIHLAFAEKVKNLSPALKNIIMIRMHAMLGSPATDDLEKWAADNIITDPLISFAAADEVLQFIETEEDALL